MKARLFLNLGLVYDHLGEPKLCSEFIRRTVFIAEKSELLEDLYRANFNLGNIYFRNGQKPNAVRCLEQAKECARKMKDKYGESECFHCIGKVQLSLGDFVAARRSLKKALLLGSQQNVDRQSVKKAFKYADRGCKLEEELGEDQASRPSSHQAVGLAEQLDLYCKVGCYSKALDAYQAQLKGAEALGKPARELAVIHVSLAATYTDLRQHGRAVEHYEQELALRQGSPAEDCSTWLNVAAAQEESGCPCEEVDSSYTKASNCAQKSGQARLQKRTLRLWLAFQRRHGVCLSKDTEAKLLELCAAEGWNPDGSDGEDEEEEMDNSEPLEDSDVVLSDSDDDLEGYDKMVSGRRKTGRWNKRNEKGETSLHRACIDGNLKQVQYLVEQGHPVNPRDYCGWTPLHEASNHGHHEIVAVLLGHGANVNDAGGPLCEGVTPLHDALSCGNFKVAQLLVERGAAVTLQNSKGYTALDTLHQWQRMYSGELDQEARQDCVATEKLLRRALAGGGPAAPAPARPFDTLQDSQLFDAENSEPLPASGGAASSSQDWLQNNRDGVTAPASPGRWRGGGSTRRHRQRGTESAVLPSPESLPNTDANAVPISGREHAKEPPAASVFEREEYQSAIRGLGSAKTRLLAQPHPQLASTPAVSSSSTSALVPEEEYVADDWLDDDLDAIQPKKKRRVRLEQNGIRGEDTSSSSAARALHRSTNSDIVSRGRSEVTFHVCNCRLHTTGPSSSSRGPSVRKNSSAKPQQPPTVPSSLPPPIRVRVRVQEDVFLIPVPQSEADSCTVSWLCEQASQRYYHKCGLLPRLSLQKEGALLSPQDLLLAVLHTNEEVLAEVCSWDLPPLPERYKKACQSLAVDENTRVTRLCEVQDRSASVSVCGLCLGPSSLSPLLRALKLQSSLTELRLSGNRLHDELLPELIATTATMPRLQVLDISACRVTAEGLEKAVNAFKGQNQAPFPCLEELNLGMNPLGDGVSEALSCLLSGCPVLARLSLQACQLTARFLQQHRLLLASALAGGGHLRSVCLSHNALGSTGLELVLKTLPLHCLTRLDLSAVRRSAADFLPLQHLSYALSQEECVLTHLSLAANGLTDANVATLARCLASCPTLVSLDISGNPQVTSAGLQNILTQLKESSRPLTLLNLEGCQVSGPWDAAALDGLSDLVQDLRLCSQALNKLDRQALKQ
uniref:Tonsoku-like protein n=1 Tax=Tetraodon nigroviridis TaxID=99883 RepID=H3DIT7_TETNG